MRFLDETLDSIGDEGLRVMTADLNTLRHGPDIAEVTRDLLNQLHSAAKGERRQRDKDPIETESVLNRSIFMISHSQLNKPDIYVLCKCGHDEFRREPSTGSLHCMKCNASPPEDPSLLDPMRLRPWRPCFLRALRQDDHEPPFQA